jgi:hypothetical protein
MNAERKKKKKKKKWKIGIEFRTDTIGKMIYI